MMNVTEDLLVRVADLKRSNKNIKAIVASLRKYGKKFGLDQPHRLAHFLAQIAHESGAFRFHEEVWGPTPAQKKYDIRTDLGNTPQRDGDGKKFKGRTPIMVTGTYNYKRFTAWCRANISATCPDFVESPDQILNDPWAGLAPIWFWSTRSLNRYADQNDIEMITRIINGGYNGYSDRLGYYGRAALVLAGYGPLEALRFQGDHDLTQDGIVGPKTRAKLHRVLTQGQLGTTEGPVVDVVVPPAAEKKNPAERSAFWVTLGGIFTSAFNAFAGLDFRVQMVALFLIVIGAVLVFNNMRKIAVQIKALRKEFGGATWV
jgi:putative chitinase